MKLHYTLLVAAAATGLSTAALAENYGDTSSQSGANASQTMDGNANAQIPGNLPQGQVQEIQTSLRERGYDLSVDGQWGPQTESAIREFQNANNLSVTGSLDSQTLAELDLDFDTSGGMTR